MRRRRLPIVVNKYDMDPLARECMSKRRFNSRDEVLQEIARIKPLVPLYPYQCGLGHWHMTKRARKEAQ